MVDYLTQKSLVQTQHLRPLTIVVGVFGIAKSSQPYFSMPFTLPLLLTEASVQMKVHHPVASALFPYEYFSV